MNHILTAKGFDRDWLEGFWFEVDMVSSRSNVLSSKVMASLFYEPSTRTRLSFEGAMVQEGGSVISTENALQFSSAVKGESLADTIRVVCGYCDVIVLRHPERGSADVASRYSTVPIINAGDGDGEHPTQALLDAYTIRERFNRLDGLQVAVVGDLRFGRTVHSLLQILSKFANNTILAVNPPQLSLPKEIRDCVENIRQFHDLADALQLGPDVVYMTRTQKERMTMDMRGMSVMFKPSYLEMLKNDAIVMHPLPRNNEVPVELDNDPRMLYFKQAHNGLKVRKALLRKVLM